MKKIIKCPKCGTSFEFDIGEELQNLRNELFNKIDKILNEMKDKI